MARATRARAVEIEAEAVQVFVANPRGWAAPAADPAGDEAFRLACAASGLAVFVHAPYLINFGSPTAETLTKSSAALAFSLRRGAAIGAAGVVVHAGSAVGELRWTEAMAQVRSHLVPLLDDLDQLGDLTPPRLLIEATAGGGGALAFDIDSIAGYLEAVDDDRVGLCIDTCHLHAAGHDLSTAARMRAAFTDLTRAVGADRIGLVHVNDSRDPAGSRRDRHAAIGQGTIGTDAFGGLFATPSLRGVALIVETEPAAQATDIATLKALRDVRRR